MRRGLVPILPALLLSSILAPVPVQAEDAEKAELRDRLRAVEDELALLRRQFEVKQEDDAREKERSAVVSADSQGFQIRSRDGKSYRLRLRGYVQTDGRFFPDGGDDTSQETFTLRRVRPIFEGTLFEYADFRIMPDFGGGSTVLQDAYLNLRPFGTLAQLQTGKFKAPFGLERLQSGTALTFVERGLPTEVAPNRDIGAMFQGDFREGLITYQAMVGNGVQDGSSADADTNDDKEVVLRVFAHPFQEAAFQPLQGLGLGFAASLGQQEGATARYRTSGRNTFFRYGSNVVEDGNRVRWSPQAYWYWGPFGALFEWVRSTPQLRLGDSNIEPDIDAFQIAASYVVTGEAASYRGVTPLKPFRGSEGGWGAWEVAARYHQLTIDDEVFDQGFASRTASAEKARAWTIGVNWYLNPFVKVSLDFDQTFFEDGGSNGGDRPTESLILSQFQVAF